LAGSTPHSALPLQPESDGSGRYSDAIALLSSLGEVAYRWSIDDDRLHWDGDVQSVLGVPADEIDSGRRYAALHDPDNSSSRHDAVFGGESADRGGGVPYRVEYGLKPGGSDGPTIWVEDFGRWYGDGWPSPRRAVGVIRVVNDRREREQRLLFRSSYDELTGFYNRARLIEILEETLGAVQRIRGSAAFLLLAIDSFRLINDCYGFDVGDQVLAVIAKRVASKLRGTDALGRFSGNKIGLVMREADDATMAVAAQRFIDAARHEVVTIDHGAIAVSISIGGVTLPRNAGTVGQATARAEEALHQARLSGPGRFRPFVYSRDRQAERQANAALSTELIGALNEQRFCLALQPIVDAKTKEPHLYECLLRLRKTGGEIVEAGSFMPLTDRLGLSRLLDRRALELALRLLEERSDLKLSVNVSADTLTDRDWLAELDRAATIRPDLCARLVVEITESTAIRNMDEAVRFIGAVRGMGCTVAMDDFGAGYSSFRNLRELAIDMVKIDGKYVVKLAEDEDDQVFVKALLQLTRHLGLKTVAEWVRDAESAALLASWGVDCLQGDFTGTPLLEDGGTAPSA